MDRAYPILTVLALLANLWLCGVALVRADELRTARERLASHETIDGQLEVTVGTWVQRLTGGLLGGERVTRERLEHMRLQADGIDRRLRRTNLGLLAAMTAFVAAPLLARSRRRRLLQHLVVASVLLLALGLWAPMLTLEVRYDVPVVGSVTIDSTTRGLLHTAAEFLTSEQWPVGAIVLVFSVVVPIVKLVLMQAALLRERWDGRIAEWLSGIGKFSMLDVFVAAVTVFLFASGTSGATNARADVGLYYFTAYCVASLAASVLMHRFAVSPHRTSGQG